MQLDLNNLPTDTDLLHRLVRDIPRLPGAEGVGRNAAELADGFRAGFRAFEDRHGLDHRPQEALKVSFALPNRLFFI